MNPDIQMLYARILRNIRTRMDDAETLYLKLCRATLFAMERDDPSGAVFPDREAAELLGQYRTMLRSLASDVSRIYRAPVRVFPTTDSASWLDVMDIGNAQLEELERIVDRLYRESGIRPARPAGRTRTAQQTIWSSILNIVNFGQEYQDIFQQAASVRAADEAERKDRAAAVISEAVEKAKAVRGDSSLNDPELAGAWNDVKSQLTVVLVELVAKLCGLYDLRTAEIRESAVSFAESVLSDAGTLALLGGECGMPDADAYGVLADALGHFCRNDFEAYAVARAQCAPLPETGFDPALFRRYLQACMEGCE